MRFLWQALVVCWLVVAGPALGGQGMGGPGMGGAGMAGGGAAGKAGAGGEGTAWLPSDQPVRVTTDTLEYCDHLLARVVQMRDAQPFAPEEVDRLTAEGRRMCAHGLVRRGIMRLRRALVRLQAEQ